MDQIQTTIPFPAGEQLFLLRPFGNTEHDLAVDFNEHQPRLVTRILAGCTRNEQGTSPELEVLWRLTRGKRIEALLLLVGSVWSRGWDLQLTCTEGDCGEDMEIELTPAELVAYARRAGNEPQISLQWGEQQICLRIPTGADQDRWGGLVYEDEAAAIRSLIPALLVSGRQVPDDCLPELDKLMREADPLAAFGLETICPACDRENSYELDLEALALKALKGSRDQLIYAIHRLAGYYHWSECQILALPAWRRAHYLALVEAEAAS